MSGRFFYMECPDCEWDCVIAEADAEPGLSCPLCAVDNGRAVSLRSRDVREDDKPEGHDARKEPAQ